MECNKEEAIRSKEIAEKKMQGKDFVGARKFIIKAQQLFPNLDNISQMLTVCDVHCSAEHKVLGSEMDWYGILQIEQTADDPSIKKQFRKLALLLHPDKNKFPGAEAAFKLIGEAQRLLSDPTKRSIYDMKRSASVRAAPQKRSQPQPSRNAYARKQPGVQANPVTGTAQFTSMNPHQQKQQQHMQPGFTNGRQTFWTSCPFCNIRYQYYRDIVNRALRCQSCMKPFIAYDLDAQGTASGANNPLFPQKNDGLNQDGHKIGPESTATNFPSSTGLQGNHGNVEKVPRPFTKTRGTSEVGGVSKPRGKEEANVRMEDGKVGKDMPREHKPSGNMNRKRRNSGSEEESSESCDTGSSTDIEADGDHVAGQNSGFTSGHNPRRSSRQKQQVKYNEDLSDDDDFVSRSKRSKGSGSPDATMKQSEASMKGETTKTDEPFDCSADFVADKKVEKQKGSAPLEESIQAGNDKAEECKKNGKEGAAGDKNSKEGPEAGNESESKSDLPEILEVPDPDFYDFDRDKSEECFAVDQMWAIYDDIDGMPRFYARIKKVYSPGFMVQITWLESHPDNQDEKDWTREKLPVACGKFRHEKTEITEDLGMFSHRVCWEKGPTRGSYKMYPIKGETWALFKNWDMKWSSDPDNHRNYEYEFVEVLSDYTKESGINVSYLVKIKGFVSLFKPMKNNGVASFQIPPNELFRFSHRVPSFRTTGREREDVREGYFELDPASLPGKIEEISDSDSKDVKVKFESLNAKCNGSSKSAVEEKPRMPTKRKNSDENNTLDGGNSKSGNGSPRLSNGCYKKKTSIDNPVEQTASGSDQVKSCDGSDAKEMRSDGVNAKPDSVEQSSSSPSLLDPCEIPEAVFYNFEDDKSHEKFRPGQIWALYCELDGLPKYYALIKRVELSPNFRVEAKWLEACAPPKGVIQWLDKKMPICCGTFTSGEKSEFDDTNSFSHLSTGVKTGRKNKYEIYPRKGEVWALYRNFNSEWSCSDLHKCEYDMVEVVEDNGVTIKVLVLSQVQGFETVFKGKRKAGREFFMEIPQDELLRFSHQVPAFQLTNEREGKLGGCWELDPKAMPVCLFSSN